MLNHRIFSYKNTYSGKKFVQELSYWSGQNVHFIPCTWCNGCVSTRLVQCIVVVLWIMNQTLFSMCIKNCLFIFNRSHSWRFTSWSWLFRASSSSPAFRSSSTTTTTNNNATTAATTTSTRTRRAWRTTSSQEILIFLFVSVALVHSTILYRMVYILCNLSNFAEYWSAQGKYYSRNKVIDWITKHNEKRIIGNLQFRSIYQITSPVEEAFET